jgi:hypothetical protein
MAFEKIPALVILLVSLGVCVWLMLQPTRARDVFAASCEKQGSAFGVELARRIRSTPPWAVRLWGTFALLWDIGVILSVIYLD